MLSSALRRRAARLRAAAVALLVLTSACGGTDGAATAPAGAAEGRAPSSAGAVQGTVTVFAAASLTGAFTELARTFESDHPNAQVTLNLGASSALAQQIVAGAPADVFAAASAATMQTVSDAGDARAPRVFVRNTLQIAVPAGNPGKVTGLDDLADPDLTIALCDEQVPCGAAAKKVFAASGITAAPDTLEQDVKAALAKVRLGEVDAALVYRTDVLAAEGEVEGVAFPEAAEAVNDYPVAVLVDAPNPTGASAFVEHVLSAEGQRVLARAGFDLP